MSRALGIIAHVDGPDADYSWVSKLSPAPPWPTDATVVFLSRRPADK